MSSYRNGESSLLFQPLGRAAMIDVGYTVPSLVEGRDVSLKFVSEADLPDDLDLITGYLSWKVRGKLTGVAVRHARYTLAATGVDAAGFPLGFGLGNLEALEREKLFSLTCCYARGGMEAILGHHAAKKEGHGYKAAQIIVRVARDLAASMPRFINVKVDRDPPVGSASAPSRRTGRAWVHYQWKNMAMVCVDCGKKGHAKMPHCHPPGHAGPAHPVQ